MFPKVVSLLILFATSAIAEPIRIEPGDYRIANIQYEGVACVYGSGGPIYVCEKPRIPFDIWNIRDAKDGGYTIDNVGLNVIRMLDTFAAVFVPRDGQPVITYRKPTIFNIEPAGNGEYVIKLQYEDLLWNAEPPVTSLGEEVKLRPAEGWESQKWRLIPAHWPLQNYNHDRWNLPQRIRKFLGYI